MIIPKQKLKERGVDYHEMQMQPCGIDITLKEVHEFLSAGELDFDNSKRQISKTKKIEFEESVFLKPGAYKVVFNEHVKIPKDLAALCLPRSSLLRCGVMLNCAVWDPGYEGRSEALLNVLNPYGITLHKNARIGQMIFIKLEEEAKELYQGVYSGENL